MTRLAALAFSLLIIVLIALSLSPEREKVVPNNTIELNNATMVLFPEADSDAVWTFDATRIDYMPEIRESRLLSINNGQRVVNGEVDFTLVAKEATIDRLDNLRGDQFFIHLLEANWDLDMCAKQGRQVFIDQSRGKFEVPLLYYRGEGIDESRDENVRMNFDLTNFEAGGPNTIGYNRFTDGVQEAYVSDMAREDCRTE